MTFPEWCNLHAVTEAEQVELAHHLAALRYRRTLETCLAPRHSSGDAGEEEPRG